MLEGIGGRERIALAMMTLFVIANLIYAARIFASLWAGAFRAAYMIEAVVIGIYLLVAIKRRDLVLAAAGVAILAWLVLSHLLFAARAHTPVNVNAVLSYLPMLAFVPLYEADTSIRRMLTLILGVSICYLLVYTLGYNVLANAGAGSSAVLGAHNGDGSRVFLAAGHTAFVAFYGLLARDRSMLFRGALVLLAGYAFWLSGSRTFSLLMVLVFTITAARMLVRPVRIAMFAGVMVVVALLLAGLLVREWNPFAYMVWDDSAYARAREYTIAMPVVLRHLMLGVGVPGVPEQLQHYVGAPRFEALCGSDLGAVGPLIDFGLPGLAAFIAAIYFAIVPPPPAERQDVMAVKCTCVTLALQGIISPTLLFEASAIFFWLLIVTGWRLQRARSLSRRDGVGACARIA